MATQIKEGDIRVNPETKQVEVYTPEGIWSSQALEQKMGAIQTQVSGIGATINSANIQPTTETAFKSSDTPPVSPPAEVPPPTTYETTPKEKDISTIIAELTATSDLPGQKEAYRIDQEKAAGLEAMKQSEADYTAQLTQLNADYKNIENKMQLGAEGRGITAAGLAPHTMAEQRKLSIQANTVSALLAATQGKITFAQSQVDKAVNDKYAQQEADRKAKIENLELLSKDPTLTVEQKKRADAQTAALKKEEEASTKKKEDSKTIMDWATKAAANSATPEQAQAIAKIATSDNPDLQKAMALYAPFAAKPEKVSTKNVMTQYLANQGIPLTVATSQGELTTSALNKVVTAMGGNLDLAQWLWQNMQAGNNFETIRQGMRNEGLDTTYLDKFVQALQDSGGGTSEI